MAWIIVANTNHYRIFDYERRPKKLTLIDEMQHPESKFKNIDLVTDRPGDYQADPFSRGSYAAHLTPKEIEIEKFAAQIANVMNDARRKQLMQDFIFIASSQLYGSVKAHLDDHLQDHIDVIQKDYSALNEADLLKVLIEHQKPK